MSFPPRLAPSGSIAAAAAIALLLVLAPAAAGAQVKSLYGSINLQYVNASFAPVVFPHQGGMGEMVFGFDTMSEKTEDTSYKYFYGAAVGGGGYSLQSSDLGKYGERSAAAGYYYIQLENKLFFAIDQPISPYIGGHVGYGAGAFWAEDLEGKPNPNGTLDLYFIGLETGFHVPLAKGYALALGASIDARGQTYFNGGFTGLYPISGFIGICYWGGPID